MRNNIVVIHRNLRRAEVVPFSRRPSPGFRPQGWCRANILSRLKKRRLSTKNGELYYYDYVFIKILEEQPDNKAAPVSGVKGPLGDRKRGGWGDPSRCALFSRAEYAVSAWADGQKYAQNRPGAACAAPRRCPCRARRGALWPNLQEPCSRASPESSQTRLGSQREGADSGAGGPSEASK